MPPSFSPLASRPAPPVSAGLAFRHRGFGLSVRCTPGRYGARSYGYTIRHLDHALHQSGGDFGSAEAADRAARRFIDDALGAFDSACAHLDAARA